MTLPRRIKKQSVRQSDRIRCPAHLKWVREHGCCVKDCANVAPIEACHVRYGTFGADRGAMGMKPGDNWTLSLCAYHHRMQHVMGEPRFAKKVGIDMVALAQEFAAKSDPLRRYLRKRAA